MWVYMAVPWSVWEFLKHVQLVLLVSRFGEFPGTSSGPMDVSGVTVGSADGLRDRPGDGRTAQNMCPSSRSTSVRPLKQNGNDLVL